MNSGEHHNISLKNKQTKSCTLMQMQKELVYAAVKPGNSRV